MTLLVVEHSSIDIIECLDDRCCVHDGAGRRAVVCQSMSLTSIIIVTEKNSIVTTIDAIKAAPRLSHISDI